jgi:hypothetical protein
VKSVSSIINRATIKRGWPRVILFILEMLMDITRFISDFFRHQHFEFHRKHKDQDMWNVLFESTEETIKKVEKGILELKDEGLEGSEIDVKCKKWIENLKNRI